MTQKLLQRSFTAAMLTLVAAVGYGQNNTLTASIPFAFRAVGSELPAGKYAIAKLSGTGRNSGTMELRNLETGKAVFIPSSTPLSEKSDAKPRLIFQCVGEDGCSLATLWSGTGTGMDFPTPPLTASQKERRETIYLERFKGK